MMAEISNRTLAILLVGAIVVSLMGTFISLNKLSQIGPAQLNQMTGMYSINRSGTVLLGVTSSSSFKVNYNVDFGTIQPNATGFWISTDSDNTGWAGALAQNCSNATGNLHSCSGLEIENDGNEVLNISFNTTMNASGLIGGTNPAFAFMARNGNLSGSVYQMGCNGTMPNSTLWTNIVANNSYILCNGSSIGATPSSGFGYVAGADKMTIEFNLTIPNDAPQKTSSTATIFLFNEP
jgi:hypothetical protein